MPSKITQYILMILIGLGMLSGCATSIKKLSVYTGETGALHLNEQGKKVLSVQYLGVGAIYSVTVKAPS